MQHSIKECKCCGFEKLDRSARTITLFFLPRKTGTICWNEHTFSRFETLEHFVGTSTPFRAGIPRPFATLTETCTLPSVSREHLVFHQELSEREDSAYSWTGEGLMYALEKIAPFNSGKGTTVERFFFCDFLKSQRDRRSGRTESKNRRPVLPADRTSIYHYIQLKPRRLIGTADTRWRKRVGKKEKKTGL